MNWQVLDNAVADALCPMFQAIVPATSTIAVVSPFLGPKGLAASVTATAVTNLAMLGAAGTCSPQDVGTTPYQPYGTCQEVEGTGMLLYISKSQGTGGFGDTRPVTKIISVQQGWLDPVNEIGDVSTCTYERLGGEIRTATAGTTFEDAQWYIEPDPGSSCKVDPGLDIPVNPPVPDHTYVDQSTNCTYNVKFQGFIQETPDGAVQPVFEISSPLEARSGGRMGGCYLDPVIHVSPPNGPGGPGGPPIPPIPVPPIPPPGPGGGVPWWAAPLLSGATGAALNLIGQEIGRLTQAQLPEGSFTLTAPCDKDDNGLSLQQSWSYPVQTAAERSLAHQITMLEALQQHLNWKTPTCASNEKPPLEGEWVTTRWISDEKMPHSNHRLRKQFRYRSKSGLSLAQRSAYWEFFQWTAGDFVVRHEGAWWGNPQVWAESEEEGKRVIRFAAGEAGLDPDQVGEWKTSRSSSPRYGMSGTMKIQLYKGFPWISSRGGASYPNTLALNHDP